jgi:hypothetical protein
VKGRKRIGLAVRPGQDVKKEHRSCDIIGVAAPSDPRLRIGLAEIVRLALALQSKPYDAFGPGQAHTIVRAYQR